MKRMAFFLGICILVLFAGTVNADSYEPGATMLEVRVQAGDTVWSIACKFCDDDHDVRELVYDIIVLNKLGNRVEVQPGQIIRVPRL